MRHDVGNHADRRLPIDQLSEVKNAELSKRLRSIDEAASALRDGFEVTASTWTFFTPENLDRVESWYRSVRSTPFLDGLGAGRSVEGPLSAVIAPLAREDYYYSPTLDRMLQRSGSYVAVRASA